MKEGSAKIQFIYIYFFFLKIAKAQKKNGWKRYTESRLDLNNIR